MHQNDRASLKAVKSAAIGADSAFRGGAPRSMKMGTTRSPCPYDAAARRALQSASLRRLAILHYNSWAAVFPTFGGGPVILR